MQFTGLAIFDGFHAWKHATRFGFPLTHAFTDDAAGVARLVTELAPDLHAQLASIEVIAPAAMKATCSNAGLRGVHHTHLVAWGPAPAPRRELLHASNRAERSSVPGVLVDGARHPGNLGAVIRVCAAANASVVLASGGLDIWHPDVVRGAAGLHAAVPVLGLADDDQVDGPLFALDADGDDIGSFRFPPGAVLAVGAERDGVSSAVRQRADGIVSLPMQSGVSSLNLATSVAAALYVHVLCAEGINKHD